MNFRCVVWNCRNGLVKPAQVELFQSLQADIAILPELRQSDILGLGPNSSIWVTNNHKHVKPKGLGVLSFGDWRVEAMPADRDMELYVPVHATSPSGEVIKILAIWNFYAKAKQGRFRGVKGEDAVELSAIRYYRNIMSENFLMAGDLNFGPTLSQWAFVDLTKRLETNEVYSLYHSANGLPPHKTCHPTYRHTTGQEHHLDHIFGSIDMLERLETFVTMPLSDVILSDHAPIYADFRFLPEPIESKPQQS